MKPTTVLLINPNTSKETTATMHRIARCALPDAVGLESCTAQRGVNMITTEQELLTAVQEVIQMGREYASRVSAIVVGAFGDPGVEALRGALTIPVWGIGESALLEAAMGERRFGVATTTPALAGSIARAVQKHGLQRQFTGCRIPSEDPLSLAADPARQDECLAQAVAQSTQLDGAQAVVIGGGPLAESAQRIKTRFDIPIISPIEAAMRRVVDGWSPMG